MKLYPGLLPSLIRARIAQVGSQVPNWGSDERGLLIGVIGALGAPAPATAPVRTLLALCRLRSAIVLHALLFPVFHQLFVFVLPLHTAEWADPTCNWLQPVCSQA